MVFGIGDIVKKCDKYGKIPFKLAYFMVVDIMDFSDEDDKGNIIEDIVYEVNKIYPNDETEQEILTEQDILLTANYKTKEWMVIINFVKDEIKKHEKNTNSFQNNQTKRKESPTITKDKLHAIKEKSKDIIEYNKIHTVDECLDAINDLTNLYKSFNDITYLQLVEDVVKRLNILSSSK